MMMFKRPVAITKSTFESSAIYYEHRYNSNNYVTQVDCHLYLDVEDKPYHIGWGLHRLKTYRIPTDFIQGKR